MSNITDGKAKVKARVLSQTMLADNIYDLWLETPLAAKAGAGRFIGIYPKDASRLLPRPLSICEADKEKARFGLCTGLPEPELRSFPAGSRVRKRKSSGFWGTVSRCLREKEKG